MAAWPRFALRSHPDPSRSKDPRVRSVLRGLKTLPAPTPDPVFRAELRQQLVAVTSRLATESATGEDAVAESGPAARARTTRPRLRRAVITFGTSVAVLVAIFGGALWLSTKAVPGDSLYGLKRASENVRLDFTSGDTARGKAYLKLASTRAQEVQTLVSRSGSSAMGSGPEAGGLNAHTTDLIRQALASEDSDTQHGSQLLTSSAVRSASASDLSSLLGWGPAQVSKLQSIAASVPAGSLRERVLQSKTVSQDAVTRATQLAAFVDSPCLNTTTSDALGPVPGLTCVPAGTPSTGAAAPKLTTPGVPTVPVSSGLPAIPSVPTTAPTLPTTVPTLPKISLPVPTSGAPTVPPVTVPVLPSTSLSVGTNGLCITVLGVVVDVGNCN